MKYEDIIIQVAREHNADPAEVEADMKAAIEAAKDNPNFQAMFGGRTPTVEEFIFAVAGRLRS